LVDARYTLAVVARHGSTTDVALVVVDVRDAAGPLVAVSQTDRTAMVVVAAVCGVLLLLLLVVVVVFIVKYRRLVLQSLASCPGTGRARTAN